MKAHKSAEIKNYKMVVKNADTLTPVGIYKRMTGKRKFLLESSLQHDKKGRYSYIGTNPYEEIIGYGNKTIVTNFAKNTREELSINAIDYLKENFPLLNLDLPIPFAGGAIGYIGYDAIRQYINIGENNLEDELNMPDIHLMIYNHFIAYEHSSEKAYLIAIDVDQEQTNDLDKQMLQLEKALTRHIDIEDPEDIQMTFQATISKDEFIQRTNDALKMIKQEKADQIVISQRMKATFNGDPFSFYRNLRSANPSPYMFYIDFDNYLIIGASPESLIESTGGHLVTNPIAGTKPRGKTIEEDRQLEKELLHDKKEVAEHEMLVDLSKEDLAKICEQDTITVPNYMKIEKYEHVMHMVSEVHGMLKEGYSSLDALIACLPAGTVSGSPKIMAMQLINQLEQTKRGFYGGGVGYITYNHDLNIALAIRSLIVKEKIAYLQSGAGIVNDSIPEKEYEETLHKAKSLIQINKN